MLKKEMKVSIVLVGKRLFLRKWAGTAQNRGNGRHIPYLVKFDMASVVVLYASQKGCGEGIAKDLGVELGVGDVDVMAMDAFVRSVCFWFFVE